MVHAVQIKKEIIMNKLFNLLIWPVIIAPAAYLALVWNRLPEKVVMKFDLQGNPTRFGSKQEMIITIIIVATMNLLVYLLLINIHRIDPKKNAVENKERLQRIAFAVAVFLSAVLCLIISSASNGNIKFNTGLILAGTGLLFAIIGNYMPNLKPNYFAGFRLPWTLENEDNWKKTHALAGKLWFAGGLLLAVVCLFIPAAIALIVFFTVITIVTIIPGVFSYRLYRQQRLKA
jgi:uncharacterized membrane protein